MSEAPVVIVGGGIGGLSAAIRLAAAGLQVIVLEQNPTIGGKMGRVVADGFHWDTGPSVITMRHVFEDLFSSAGRRLEDYLRLQPIEPLTRYFYPDGTVLDATRNLPRMLEQIGRLNPRDVEGYLAYLHYVARLHRITGPVFIYDQPPALRSVLRVSPLDALRVDGLRTMDQAIQGFVRSPHLRQLLGRFATYVGASPYRAPATLNVIGHVELNGGVWYPTGGVYRIAEAMARLVQELGGEIRTSARVVSIDLASGAAKPRVRGVTLADGAQLPAQSVIANVDVAQVYEHLLPPDLTARRRVRRLLAMEPSCSGFILLLGLRRTYPHLAHHNIFFSSDYRREFDAIFRQATPASEPTIYIAITSKTDPDHAPSGHENWFVLVNVPALGPAWDWGQNAASYRDCVLDRLGEFGLDVREHLVAEQMITPLDLERLTGARQGALYGSSSNNRFAAFRRPHNRAPEVAGLYFAGGTTHPGGGVPLATLSGRVAAALALRDNGGL